MVGDDAGGSRAMMVLFVKQTHLQKEVGAAGWGPGVISRVDDGENGWV